MKVRRLPLMLGSAIALIAVRALAAAPEPAPDLPERERNVLIVIGALIALAMFLWERRRKD